RGASITVGASDFLSFAPPAPFDCRASSAGSEAFLSNPGELPTLAVFNTLDQDGDFFPLPYDNCPGVANRDQRDSNGDGLGDFCDPAADPSASLDSSWAVRALDPNPGQRLGAAAAFDEARGVTVLF